MISFRQRNNLSWMGNSLYWPPRWYKWARRTFFFAPWIILILVLLWAWPARADLTVYICPATCEQTVSPACKAMRCGKPKMSRRRKLYGAEK